MKTYSSHLPQRYQRQLLLNGFGEAAQEKLSSASIAVIGAGGLGCPALTYLAAAGVGHIGIIDFDRVEASNLHRQVIFKESDIGQLKAVCAAASIKEQNSDIVVNAITERIHPSNCVELLKDYDIIFDGTDNFSTRYLLNDACVLLGKPLIYGAISQFQGQVSLFRNNEPSAVQYRDLFPEPPAAGTILNCAEAGVLGVLPGIIGIMMATEAIKFITGIGVLLENKLLTYDALTCETMHYEIVAQPGSKAAIPTNRSELEQTDYAFLCGESSSVREINIETFNALLKDNNFQLIDVRNPSELPVPTDFNFTNIPLPELIQRADEIKSKNIVLFCQSGIRSKKAATLLQPILPEGTMLYSLAGGIQHRSSI